MTMQVDVGDQARQDELYWTTVKETIRQVFRGDPEIIAGLERAIVSRPWMERQAFYNSEPLTIAAEMLDATPTAEQKERYYSLSEHLVAEASAPAPQAEAAGASGSSRPDGPAKGQAGLATAKVAGGFGDTFKALKITKVYLTRINERRQVSRKRGADAEAGSGTGDERTTTNEIRPSKVERN